MALIQVTPVRKRENIIELLSAATIHPEELGEPGPRMGLDPKQPNPYYSSEKAIKQALDSLVRDEILKPGQVPHTYVPEHRFQHGKFEAEVVATMRALELVHPFVNGSMPPAQPVAFTEIASRTRFPDDKLERLIRHLTTDGYLEDSTPRINGESLRSHAFNLTARGGEFLQEHRPVAEGRGTRK